MEFRQQRGSSMSRSSGSRFPNSIITVNDLHSPSRVRHRLVNKTGESNISRLNVEKLGQRYIYDIFTTMIEADWIWFVPFFFAGFIASWLVLAGVWWVICYSHGDMDKFMDEKWMPCVHGVHDFTSALLFSIETQHTIGYGSRYTTDHCEEAVLLQMVQSCVGVIIQALMSGLVFLKLSRPNNRTQTIMFSRKAVICLRDGHLTLLCRISNFRRSHIITTHTRGILIKRRETIEGEIMPLEHIDLKFGNSQGNENVFLIAPMIIEHKINETSPFYHMSQQDLAQDNFELLVMLEGVNESTSMSVQAVTSYLPSEILWGHRLERLVSYEQENGEYLVDYSRFHCTVPVAETPCCSARELDLMTRLEDLEEADAEELVLPAITVIDEKGRRTSILR